MAERDALALHELRTDQATALLERKTARGKRLARREAKQLQVRLFCVTSLNDVATLPPLLL